jgi:hypothetical protein
LCDARIEWLVPGFCPLKYDLHHITVCTASWVELLRVSTRGKADIEPEQADQTLGLGQHPVI